MRRKKTFIYATTSAFKIEEVRLALEKEECYVNGSSHNLGSIVNFEFSDVATSEPLSCNLEEMVRHKVVSAYGKVGRPCIAEHAGIIFEEFVDESYPGGLTQPMWDALGAVGFLREQNAAGKKVIARAVVGYCDGLAIRIFKGETVGKLTETPKGERDFYWDNIFSPDECPTKTYAEITQEDGGLLKKVKLSQSIKALKGFAAHIASESQVDTFF